MRAAEIAVVGPFLLAYVRQPVEKQGQAPASIQILLDS